MLYATLSIDLVRPSIPAGPVLLPANSFARHGFPAPRLPAHVSEVAVDCGAYAVAREYLSGTYPWSMEQYVAWLLAIHPRPRWAALWDYVLDPASSAADPVAVERQQWLTTMEAYDGFARFHDVDLAWVPTVHGRAPDDFAAHAESLLPLIRAQEQHYAALDRAEDYRVGIGSLVALSAAPREIARIARAVADVLGSTRLHLWGVKKRALCSPFALPPTVQSADTAAYGQRFGRGIAAHNAMMASHGLSQREAALRLSLPAYRAGVEAGRRRPQQHVLPM